MKKLTFDYCRELNADRILLELSWLKALLWLVEAELVGGVVVELVEAGLVEGVVVELGRLKALLLSWLLKAMCGERLWRVWREPLS